MFIGRVVDWRETGGIAPRRIPFRGESFGSIGFMSVSGVPRSAGQVLRKQSDDEEFVVHDRGTRFIAIDPVFDAAAGRTWFLLRPKGGRFRPVVEPDDRSTTYHKRRSGNES